MAHFEVLVRSGSVIDGTGAPSKAADIGVRRGLVESVGNLAGATADVVLDAAGLTVTPGFIDTHSHADVATYLPDQEPFNAAIAPLLQGVTTEVCGNCGFSPFPVLPVSADLAVPVMEMVFAPGSRTFSDAAHYQAELADRALPTNLAPLVGHGTLRSVVVGPDNRRATYDEQLAMERLLETCLEQGAFGLSSGLIYPPALYADTVEVQRLAAVAGRWGRLYTTHMRSETAAVLDAMDEARAIAGSGTALHISHHKVAGRENFGRSGETLAWVERQVALGTDVTLDAYPYTAGSTTMMALLPPDANEGPLGVRLARLADRSVRDRIRAGIANGVPGWENLIAASGWDGVVVAGAPATPEAEGHSLATLADGGDPVDVMCALLRRNDGGVTVVVHMMDQADVDAIITSERAMVGSDGVPKPGRPHPRLTGTFARFLGEVARERRLLDPVEAVRRMTSVPADRFGLVGRGRVRRGAVADLAVVALDRVAERGTYVDPWQAPEGVVHVLVGGVPCVQDGRDTGRRNGEVLRAA